MKILTLNLGSSSLKYKLFGEKEIVFSSGMVDKIGVDGSIFKTDDNNIDVRCPTHKEAFELLTRYLIDSKYIASPLEIDLVAHRVVHGGVKYSQPTIITQDVLNHIEELFMISPLHNPINHKGILLSMAEFTKAKQVAIFDTAFYHNIPHKAFLYGIPYKYYREYGIRKYGFHGISHRYIASEVMKLMKKRSIKHISCHLGNGSSITAIHNGQAMDTTMGFTPLQGVIMGTRSGSIDPAIVPFLAEKENLSIKEVNYMLNHESGIQGVSEISSDVRDIYQLLKQGDWRARMTLEMISYQIMKFIGSLSTTMGGVNVITFTGGIGQNAFYIRKMALENLGYLGVKIDDTKNEMNEMEISASDSKVKVFIIPANEELEMYRESLELINNNSSL